MISASQDDEEALSNMLGSMFTQALNQALLEAHRNASFPSLRELRQSISTLITANTLRSERFSPNLVGNEALLDSKFTLNKLGQRGLFNAKLSAVATKFKNVTFNLSKTNYQINDTITFRVTSATAGYLSLIAVNAYDEAIILLPNYLNPEVVLSAGRPFIFEPPKVKYYLKGKPPVGRTEFFAIVTEEPLQLSKYSLIKDTTDDNAEPISSPLSIAALQTLNSDLATFTVSENMKLDSSKQIKILGAGNVWSNIN